MKKSIFAKILILVMCLSLLLCACGKDDSGSKNDPTDAPTSAPTNPADPTDGPEDPENPGDDDASGLSGILGTIFGDDVTQDDLLAALECGKVTITVGDMITNVMYVDVANLKFVDELTMNVEGTEVNAQLYVNQNDLVVALPEMLPDAYGISFDTLMTDLPTSAIWGLMGTTYEDFMAELATYFDEILNTVNSLEGMFSDAEETMESLMVALSEALENVEQTSGNGQATIYGETVDAWIVSYKVDNEAMEQIVNIMLDWCTENAESIVQLMDQEDLTEQNIIDAISDAKAEVGTLFDTSELEAVLSMNYHPDTEALMSIDGSFSGTIDGDEGGYYLNLTLGVDPAESDLYSFSLLDSYNDGYAVTLGRKVENTKTTYTITAYGVTSGESTEMMVASASYDTASHAYQLTLDADGESYAVNGTCKVTDEIFEFTLDTLSANGEITQVNLKVAVEGISSSEIPDAPTYKNILQMSEQELTELLSMFQTEEA